MNIKSIINRYVFTGMISPFLINVIFFTLIFLTTKIIEITNLIVNYRIGLFAVARLFLYSMPYFLVFVIPMSVMMGVLLTFLRMATDNEIVALKSGGVSLYQLLPPVLVFSFIGCMLTALMTFYGMPWGKSAFKQLVYDVAVSNVNVGLKERTFNDAFEDVVLYVNAIDPKTGTLEDVFIEDRRHDRVVSTIVARKGELHSLPGAFTFVLNLSDGIVNQVNLNQKTSNAVTFDTYDLTLAIGQTSAAASGDKDADEMTLKELSGFISSAEQKNTKYYKALIALHNKFSIPLACLVMGILGVPLGVQAKATKRSYGLGLGLFFFLCYYALLSLGWVLGESGTYPPSVGIYVPNAVMGAVGVLMMVRTANERPVKLGALLERAVRAFRKQTEGISGNG